MKDFHVTPAAGLSGSIGPSATSSSFLPRLLRPIRPRLRPRPRPRPRAAGLCLVLLLTLAAVSCDRSEPVVSIEAIREMQAAGRFAGTLEPLRALLAERPGDPEASYLYGRALAQTGQISLATWPLRQAMRDPDWMVPAAMQLSFAALASGDFNEVVDVTSRVLEENEENVLARLLRAQAHAHWKKDAAAAVSDARRVLDLEPDRLEAYEPLILGLLALKRSEEAREALDEAGLKLEESEASDTQMAWHCSTTALLALDDGEIDRGREIWQGCLELYPADANVVNGATSFFDAQGESARSIEILRRALEEAPAQRSFRTALAERLRLTGAADEAEALLRAATDEGGPSLRVAAWLDLAKLLHAQSDLERAAEAVAKAVDVARESGDEPDPKLLFQYADALVLAGRLDRALETAQEIAVPAQRGLIEARVLQQRGDSAAALEKFDEVLRVWPDNASARYYAAVAAEGVGDFDRALEEYRYAIRIAVGATDARTRAARQLIAEGKPLVAYQILFIESGKYPLEPEGAMLSMYLMGRVANPRQLQNALSALAMRDPARVPEALAQGAQGVADVAGPGAALHLLSSAPGIDPARPQNAPVLRALVRFAHAAGQPELAERAVEAAVSKHPDSSSAYEIRAAHLELAGASAASEPVREARARAIELDPGNALALAGLGRSLRESHPEQALELFERAIAADPADVGSQLAAAQTLRGQGRHIEAAERLDDLLSAHPHEAEVAAERAEIDLETDTIDSSTLSLARRAARFGGRPADWERVARVHSELGQPEQAARSLERARRLRESRNAETATRPPGA